MIKTFDDLNGQGNKHRGNSQKNGQNKQRYQFRTIEHPVRWRQGIIDKRITGDPVAVHGFAGIENDNEEYKKCKDIVEDIKEQHGAWKIRHIIIPAAHPEYECKKSQSGQQDNPEIIIPGNIA